MTIDDLINVCGNGIDQTNILLTFAILDVCLGIAWRIKNHHHLVSNKMMSGLVRNFVPSILPAILHFLHSYAHSDPIIYKYASFLIFVCCGYFIIQSIIVNLNFLGTPLPDWLYDWLLGEIKSKGGR